MERIAAHSDECGPTFDALRRSVAHWQIKRALWSWRLGERERSRVATHELRSLYEEAIQRGVDALRDFTSLPAPNGVARGQSGVVTRATKRPRKSAPSSS